MKHTMTLFIALSLLLAVTGCDGHMDVPSTAMRPGHILCTDGMAVSYDECMNTGKEPIAVVFYVNHDENVQGQGYAVYLHDIGMAQFADSIGVSQGSSADLSSLDGNENTFALYNATAVSSPMGELVFDMWKHGQSAYIPSVAQMRLLYYAKNTINPYIEALGGDPLPDDADNCWYWTSTEVDGQQTAKAWLYSLGSGAIQETPKIQAHKVRPIITINN